ncbi:MAG: hypothetical protein EBU40_14600 [Proteobacteria bacterium]|nr:hypothetical protein [Pseudomonadota bacterium]
MRIADDATARGKRGQGKALTAQLDTAARAWHARAHGVRLAWVVIPFIAILLGGVVWVNVARLNLTTQTGRTVDMYDQVQSDVLKLRAKLAQKDGQVVDQAARRLGMVQAPGTGLTYVTVPNDARVTPGQAPRTR